MYRQKKLSEDCPKSDGEKSSNDAGSGDESSSNITNLAGNSNRPPSPTLAPTSSSSPPPPPPSSNNNSAAIITKMDTTDTTKLTTVNKSPDIVSSTLPPKQELVSHLDKSMEMLRQIFPGKPTKILEAKLRDARGDVVKALELCAKYFDQKELKSSTVSNGSAHPLFSRNSMKTPPRSPPILPQENNNNPFMLNFGNHNLAGNSNTELAGARFPPPFSTAAMAAMLANSQHHKSAFIPTTAAAVSAANLAGNSNQLNHQHHFYRNFEHGHPAANFLNKELFPFPPPPLFPPSFFVGFGNTTNHLVNQAAGLTAANLAALNNDPPPPVTGTLPSPALHRPCVDPLCGQCAAATKVDSTDDNNTKDNEVEDLNHA